MPTITPKILRKTTPAGPSAFLFVPPTQQKPVKGHNVSIEIRHNVLTAIAAMRNPLIAIHVRPDEDALGTAFAMALHLNLKGKGSIYIPEKEMRFMPKFIKGLIAAEGIRICHTISKKKPYDLIAVDTARQSLLELPIQELIEQGHFGRLVDIDHHVGDPLMAHPSLSFVSHRVSSSAELLCQLLPEKDISPAMARCLLAGILGDTKNLKFMVGRDTESKVRMLERISGVTRHQIFPALKDLNLTDVAVIAKALPGVRSRQIRIGGKGYKLAWIDQPMLELALEQARQDTTLTEPPRNFRKALEEEIGFGTNKPDIVLIIDHDPTKGIVRGGLYAYNQGSELDFRLTAEEIIKSQPEAQGGGHRGAAKFDLLSYHEQDPAEVIAIIIRALQNNPPTSAS